MNVKLKKNSRANQLPGACRRWSLWRNGGTERVVWDIQSPCAVPDVCVRFWGRTCCRSRRVPWSTCPRDSVKRQQKKKKKEKTVEKWSNIYETHRIQCLTLNTFSCNIFTNWIPDVISISLSIIPENTVNNATHFCTWNSIGDYMEPKWK